MKNSQIEDMLKQEADNIEIKISDKVLSTPLQERRIKAKQTSKSRKLKIAFSSLFSCLAVAIVCLMVGLFLPQNSFVSVSALTSYIIEINPSFCVTANSKDEVVSVCALNSDGDIVVSDSAFNDLTGMTLDGCFEKIIEITYDKGFFDSYSSDIKIHTINNKTDFAEEKANQAKDILEKNLEQFNLGDINIVQDSMKMDEFKEKMQFDEDFEDLDDYLKELEGRRYSPDFKPEDEPKEEQKELNENS